MEKKREQDFANQEALRLSGVFNTPIPAQPPEREKALDKVKEPPRVCGSLVRAGRCRKKGADPALSVGGCPRRSWR